MTIVNNLLVKNKDLDKIKFLSKYETDIRKNPYSNGIYLPTSNLCSRFAIKSFMQLYNVDKKYTDLSANAWDIKYKKNQFSSVWNYKCKKSFDITKFREGVLFGIYYPDSKFNEKIDIKNNKLDYTHLALYVGKLNSKHYFLHMFKTKVELISYNDLFSEGIYSSYNFKIREIFVYNDFYTKKEIKKIKKELVREDIYGFTKNLLVVKPITLVYRNLKLIYNFLVFK